MNIEKHRFFRTSPGSIYTPPFIRMKELFETIRKVFASKNTFVLTTHVNPDGDGLGSEVALALYLTGIGKKVSVINQSQTPAYYTFLHALFPVSTFIPEKHVPIITDAEVFIALDTNSPSRFPALNDAVSRSASYKVCIDHHLDRAPFADLYIIDESATATGEIMFNLLKSLDSNAITLPVAQALYAAIMTDTGSFRFPKTDSETHRIAAELLQSGADPTAIYQKIFEEGSVNRLRLLGRALESISLHLGGRVASIALRRKDFAETSTAEEDTDNMINYALSIGGVKIGLMFTELSDCVKVSFRSKGNIPINQLAKEFGGNGHLNAAGARVTNTPIETVRDAVVNKAASYLLKK